MKEINTRLIITSLRAKVDGSIGISASTPELSKAEKSEFFDLQNVELEASLKPLGFKVEQVKVEKGLDGKSPSQRLRAVLFVYWKQQGEEGDFEVFYRQKMDNLINMVKEKLI